MEKKVYYLVRFDASRCSSHPSDDLVVGVYSSKSYAVKVASRIPEPCYVICEYSNGFRKIYANVV